MILPSLSAVKLNDLRKNCGALLLRGQNGYRADVGVLGLDAAKSAEITAAPELVIGEIDQDGFVRSEVGALDAIPVVTAKEFVSRTRFDLTLVARNGMLTVRKDYRGNQQAFLREIHALDALAQAGCNVPALLDIDFDQLRVEMSYIAGSVVREALADSGAVVRDRDVARHEFADLGHKEKRLARVREGRSSLAEVVDAAFIEDLFRQLRVMHSLRFIWGDIKYGNVVIEKDSGEPFLIDFDGASYHPDLGGRAFRRLADSDIEKFNLHFGTDKLTTEALRLRAKAIPLSEVYAPACFTAGISIGNLWDNNNGYGRWRFLLNQALPPLEGARVLDLGANNGFNSLQLLRNGAREVVAVELDDKFFEQGKFLQAAFEYTDCANYNFRYLHANMMDIMTKDLGRFDFVMALCCIYYLDDDNITGIARHLSTITNTFVLQCNTAAGIDRSDPHTYEKASVEYAQKILTDAGFSDIEIIAPAGYNRPLVIGHRPK
jgi:tRNA A-37 threonylcarbamoyl transferase component Bud32/2-polyprenyl-3-methyl-5-hydroxy-6-metoxy-1,4-benzoquinol methylase